MSPGAAAPHSSKSKIKYVIFDMDGLLLDSERIYTEVTNDILGRFGKRMTLDIKAGLMGKPDREAAEHLLSFFPDVPITLDEYLRERDVQQNLLWPHVQPMPGAVRLVQHLRAHGVPFALATSSRRANFELKSSNLPDLFDCFGDNVVCADDLRMTGDGVQKKRGKPCPDIFLVAARELLGVPVGTAEVDDASPEEQRERSSVLVFEDAIPGVEAGKRAGMKVVWVADSQLQVLGQSAQYRADSVLESLEEFDPTEWGLPEFAVKE